MSIVVTSINDVPAPSQYSGIYPDQNIIWIGDKKSRQVKTDSVDFYDVGAQLALSDLTLPDALPHNHYSRKKFGYLIALLGCSSTVPDTDDDNFPIHLMIRFLSMETITFIGYWKVNIYSFF